MFIYLLREHPFNLKGRGGGYVFLGNFCFCQQIRRHILFSVSDIMPYEKIVFLEEKNVATTEKLFLLRRKANKNNF